MSVDNMHKIAPYAGAGIGCVIIVGGIIVVWIEKNLAFGIAAIIVGILTIRHSLRYR